MLSRLIRPAVLLHLAAPKMAGLQGKNKGFIECHKNGVKRRKCHLRETKSAKFRGAGVSSIYESMSHESMSQRVSAVN